MAEFDQTLARWNPEDPRMKLVDGVFWTYDRSDLVVTPPPALLSVTQAYVGIFRPGWNFRFGYFCREAEPYQMNMFNRCVPGSIFVFENDVEIGLTKFSDGIDEKLLQEYLLPEYQQIKEDEDGRWFILPTSVHTLINTALAQTPYETTNSRVALGKVQALLQTGVVFVETIYDDVRLEQSFLRSEISSCKSKINLLKQDLERLNPKASQTQELV